MPRTDAAPAPASTPRIDTTGLIYSPAARMLHWIVAGLVFVTVPIGVVMVYRGNTLNLWDDTTNALYSTHKLIGVIIFVLIVARLVYRFSHGAPAPEPTLTPFERVASGTVHWAIYLLLFIVPIGGYLGVSYYPALDIFSWKLPGFVTPDEPTANQIFKMHALGAFVLAGLVAVHIGAALMHAFIKRDGVLGRMIPSMKRRD